MPTHMTVTNMLVVFSLLILPVVVQVEADNGGAWAVAKARFTVHGPPAPGMCTLVPQDDDLLGFLTQFELQCTRQGDDAGDLVYKVYCAKPGETTQHLLYRGHELRASGIVLPTGRWNVYVQVENRFHMSSRADIGTFTLTAPPSLDNRVIGTELAWIKSLVLQGDSQAAVSRTNLMSFALEDMSKDAGMTLQMDHMKTDLLQVLQVVPTTTDDEIRENLVAVGNILAAGKVPPSKAVRESTSDVLVKLSDSLLAVTNQSDELVVEKHLHNDAKKILTLVEDLMVLQRRSQEPSQAPATDVGARVSDNLQKTISSISEVLLRNREPGNVVSLSTPQIEVKAWKTTSNETAGRALEFRDVVLEMPEGLGEGNVSISAVATSINPRLNDPKQYSSNFISVSTTEEKEEPLKRPLVFHFARKENLSLEEGSPNVAFFNLSGNAHCVRYSNTPKLYGWRVVSNRSATATVRVPAGGRSLVQVVPLESHNLKTTVLKMTFKVSNGTLGQTCWPEVDDRSYENIKVVRRHANETTQEEFWVENGRRHDIEVNLTFLLAYTNLAVVNASETCDASVADEKAVAPRPVNTSIKLVQMSGQCVVYDEQSKAFVSDDNCKAFPSATFISCRCGGASLHTTLVVPPTNQIHFELVDISVNPLPLIFFLAVSCAFLVLCLLAFLQDRKDQGKLLPLADPTVSHLPIKYNVFLYTSRFPLNPGSPLCRVSLTLLGSYGLSITNTFTSPGTTFGSMLHLVHHSAVRIGQVKEVALTLHHPTAKWHVDRVVVSDAVEFEVVVFPINAWVSKVEEKWPRMSDEDRNCWRENFLARLCLRVMETIPLLLIYLPGRIRQRKLDRMFSYALGTSIWALLHLWFYETRHPFYQHDDCIAAELSLLQKMLPLLLRLVLNFSIITVATMMLEGVISISLMSGERYSRDPRDKRLRGLLPLPHWCCVVSRVIAGMGLVTTICLLVFMSYSLSQAEFHQWLAQIGEAFALQIFSRSLRAMVSDATLVFRYPKNPKRFHETIVNPEGVNVMCPECRVCTNVPLHSHFGQHLLPGKRLRDTNGLFSRDTPIFGLNLPSPP